MSQEKLFGKWGDIVMLLLGFLLTGVVGSFISNKYAQRTSELDLSKKLFEEYNLASGNRYHLMNQILYALNDNREIKNKWNVEELEKRWDKYREELQNWNTIRGYLSPMMKFQFGENIWRTERDIHYQFRAWGIALEQERNQPRSIDFECLFEKRNELLKARNSFGYSLAEAIQSGKIGSERERSEDTKNPIPNGWCLLSQ